MLVISLSLYMVLAYIHTHNKRTMDILMISQTLFLHCIIMSLSWFITNSFMLPTFVWTYVGEDLRFYCTIIINQLCYLASVGFVGWWECISSKLCYSQNPNYFICTTWYEHWRKREEVTDQTSISFYIRQIEKYSE